MTTSKTAIAVWCERVKIIPFGGGQIDKKYFFFGVPQNVSN